MFQFCDGSGPLNPEARPNLKNAVGKARVAMGRAITVGGVVWAALLFVEGCGAKGQAEVPPWPGSALPAGAFCRRQVADTFDDLGTIRAAMRQIECLVVLRENRPELDPQAFSRIRKLYARTVEDLAKKNRWDSHHEAWERLYMLAARINGIRNDLARQHRIPVFSVNGHHGAAALWAQVARRHPAPTLLHLDSHADTRGLRDPQKVLEIGRRILTGRKFRKAGEELTQYLNDPATPCSAGVLILGFKSFVWAKPHWYGLKNIVTRPMFYGKHTEAAAGEKLVSKKWTLFYDRSQDPTLDPKIPSDSTWTLLSKPAAKLGKFGTLRKLKVSVLTTSPWPTDTDKEAHLRKVLLEAVPKGSFVLDIDLDYFGTVDLTDGLIRKAPPSKYEARNEYLKKQNVKAREEKFRAHIRYVDARMKEVERMLRFLRDHGRIPTMVTLADSTYMPYALHWWAEEFWEYTPKRFVPYLQLRMRRVLAHVYAAYGIGALP